MEIALVFPHQLFEKNPMLKKGMKIYLIEEHLFFRQYAFHKQKLVFHRASMKCYQHFLSKNTFDVTYIDSTRPEAEIRKLIRSLSADSIHVTDPADNYLIRRIHSGCQQKEIKLHIHESPCFLNTRGDLRDFFRPERQKYHQTEFYIQQRKSEAILLDKDEKPIGGKWSYDADNRKKYPSKQEPPGVVFPSADSFYQEATAYVKENFPENYGRLPEAPRYPHHFNGAKAWLRQFLENRFSAFGDYEDALVSSHSILHHSLLSPLLNTGLLTPEYVIKEILQYAESHKIAINNTEGIIRQIIGWREFIRGIYEVKGTAERTRNFWGFTRRIPPAFYKGTTGIDPVDLTIKKLLETGYTHHIERLMVLGNFMLLCEFDPDEVYRWFMELYIDAFDWVMVPNVYGMSQFADGGLMATKPYISGSNYLMKMGDYQKGDWQAIWDALFWRFMHVHRDFFLSNPRLGMLVRTFDKMSMDKQNAHLQTAKDYLSGLK